MFWNNTTQKMCAVCDIGSASVSVAFVIYGNNIKPKIIYSVHVPVSVQQTPEKDLEKAILNYLDTAFTLISTQKSIDSEYQHLPKKIDCIHIFFSSPWYVSKTRNILLQKEKSFILKKESIENLVKDEEQKLQQDVLMGKYNQIAKSDTVAIEREIVKVLLNGYETVNPYMKEARTAELTLFFSVIQTSILSKIKMLCEKHLHTDTIHCHTFPLASFGSIRTLFPHESNFFIIDVAGEMTDITEITSSMIQDTKAYPLGRNTLLRNVCDACGVTPEIASSFLTMYANKSLDANTHSNMQKIVHDFTDVWKKEVLISMKEIHNQNKKIFLTCDEEIRKIIIESFIDDGSHDIIALDTKIFNGMVLQAKHSMPDQFVLLETVFLSIHGFM